MLITICNLSYYNLYHIIMCFVKINHQSINQKTYHKVESTSMSHLEAHAGFFRLSIKVKLIFIYCDLFGKS